GGAAIPATLTPARFKSSLRAARLLGFPEQAGGPPATTRKPARGPGRFKDTPRPARGNTAVSPLPHDAPLLEASIGRDGTGTGDGIGGMTGGVSAGLISFSSCSRARLSTSASGGT